MKEGLCPGPLCTLARGWALLPTLIFGPLLPLPEAADSAGMGAHVLLLPPRKKGSKERVSPATAPETQGQLCLGFKDSENLVVSTPHPLPARGRHSPSGRGVSQS